ncbi:glutamate receptor 1-like protein [Dinothrombium tinctorium]|uniref:Glutamate receptor 1-like protein n=1 Tax=Dinothrombium tinctorium TaxID=1965070 RepID=A0A3S3PJX2_9ACAR
MDRGIFALITSVIDPVYDTVISFSNTFKLPFIHLGFSPKNYFRAMAYGITMKPRYLPAVIDVMKFYAWKQVIYLYDSDDGLIKLQHLFTLVYNETSFRLNLRAVRRISNADDGFQFLRQIEMNDRKSQKLVLIDCAPNASKTIIALIAQDIYTSKDKYHFLLSNLVLDDYIQNNFVEHGAINVTGFRILKTNSVLFRGVLKLWRKFDPKKFENQALSYISASEALTYDSIAVIFDAFDKLLAEKPKFIRGYWRKGQSGSNRSRSIDCLKDYPIIPYEHGANLIRSLKKTQLNGLSGDISFEAAGFRTNFSVDIVQMTINSQMAKIAEWTEKENLKTVPAKYHRIYHESMGLENKTYIVTSILEEPYLMKRESEGGVPYQDNERFEGYCKDLADLIANYVGFKYVLKLVNDSRYGGIDPTKAGGWNGMVGEIIRQ